MAKRTVPQEQSTDTPARLEASTINVLDLAHLDACTEDARNGALDSDPGPAEPTDFFVLRGRLEAARAKLPPLYRDTFAAPFLAALDRLGEPGLSRVLVRDPKREGEAGLLLDMAQAILQQGESYAEIATDAFQEVVSDLYDGFLSAEDRKGVNPPDRGTIPPLVKWGNPEAGPYTWPVEATSSLGVKAGVVNLPPANIRRGLLAWAALGHETAGHDILGADTGLRDELTTAVQESVSSLDSGLSEYWSERIDETASDVLGILNMGPAAAIGLVGYFRGLNWAYGGAPKLRNHGPADDPHPADILRGYLAAETVRLLKFSGKTQWANAITRETDKDVGRIVIDGAPVEKSRAQRSAELVAKALVSCKARSLERHALGEIQNWRDADERKVQRLRTALRTAAPLSSSDLAGAYAAHAVAAAVIEALSAYDQVAIVFGRMLTILKGMHEANPSWGPLYVAHPGNFTRRVAYAREGEPA